MTFIFTIIPERGVICQEKRNVRNIPGSLGLCPGRGERI